MSVTTWSAAALAENAVAVCWSLSDVIPWGRAIVPSIPEADTAPRFWSVTTRGCPWVPTVGRLTTELALSDETCQLVDSTWKYDWSDATGGGVIVALSTSPDDCEVIHWSPRVKL